MASIRIHQDLYNFERKIKGFTVRQAVSIAVGAVCALGGVAFATGALGLPLAVSGIAAVAFMAVPIVCGFMPVYGLSLDEAVLRHRAMARRGDALTVCLEEKEIEGGDLSRAHRKEAKRSGYEASNAGL